MAENKTKPSASGVKEYLEAIQDPSRRKSCEALHDLMAEATGEAPLMWGTSIVGFGSYHYKYESGREGDSCVVGFASRKADIVLYLVYDFPGMDELLAKLGPHKRGKACLYLKSLEGIDTSILSALVQESAKQRKRNHP